MERALKADAVNGNKEIASKKEKPPEKTFWKRMKEKLAKGIIIVLGITVAAAVPCAVVSSGCSNTPADTKFDSGTTDTDTDVDTDTDSDTDTDVDTDTDTDVDSDTDTDTDTDSDTDTDTDSDTDTDTDMDAGPDGGDTDTMVADPEFTIPGAEVTIAKELVSGMITITAVDPSSWLTAPDGYRLRVSQIHLTSGNPADLIIMAPFPGPITYGEITEQGQTIFGPDPPGVYESKWAHLYKSYVLTDEVNAALLEEPIVLTEGNYVDLGNGVAGIVSIKWRNQDAADTDDPKFIYSIEIGGDLDGGVDAGPDGGIGMTNGTWGPSAPVTPGFGVPVCTGDEGLGITASSSPACGRPDTAPTARVFIEIGGELWAITNVNPPSGLYPD